MQLSEKDISKFWLEFEREVENFSKSTVFKTLDIRDYFNQKNIIECLQDISRHHNSGYDPDLRVYLQGKRCLLLEKKVINNPPHDGEDLQRWLHNTCGDERVCLILKKIEQASLKTVELLLPFINLGFEHINLNNHRLEMYCILGDYGYTPTGIHIDGRYISNLHFHIGPSPKTMYLWEPSYYKSINGSLDFNYEPSKDILETGKTYCIEPGDLYFLPEDVYHIGFTHGFSVGILLSFQRLYNDKLLLDATSQFLKDRVSTIPSFKFNYKKEVFANRKVFINNLIDPIKLDKNFIFDSIDDYLLRLKSNYNMPALWAKKEPSILWNKTLKFKAKPFIRVEYKEVENQLYLYIRGNKIVVQNHPAITFMIEKINANAPFSMQEIDDRYAELFNDLMELIKIFYTYNLIEPINNEN